MKRHRKNMILSLGCQGPFSMGCTTHCNLKGMSSLLWWQLWLVKCHVKKNPPRGDFQMKNLDEDFSFQNNFPTQKQISCLELIDCNSKCAILG